MRRATAIADEAHEIKTIEGLTGVFESIASIKIARIRGRVVQSKKFFSELWQTYSDLRIDPSEQIGRRKGNDKIAYLLVTSSGKLSGAIDDMVISRFLDTYNYTTDEADIITIGAHGTAKLKEHDITSNKDFALPEADEDFSVLEIINNIKEYSRVVVYYQTYESLRTQKVATIELKTAVAAQSSEVEEHDENIVSTKNYIFEPSIGEIAKYLESLMMAVALTQVIMESKLAQHASRFNAMNSAKQRAHDLSKDLTMQYHRSKRSESDERLKEIMKVVVSGVVT